MQLFNPGATLEMLNKMSVNTMVTHLGIEFTAMGEDFIEARMPVDHRTHQPLGLLHGGASVVLAETLGSVAATCCVDITKQYCVGYGLAVVRVVRGAAEGCNIVIPPQKIAEIREKKKIVIDEHSGRILADVDMESLDESDKPKKAGAAPAPARRRKTVE